MNKRNAIATARRLARKRQTATFVVQEDGEFVAAIRPDLDTWFAGAPVRFTVEPDGTIEENHAGRY